MRLTEKRQKSAPGYYYTLTLVLQKPRMPQTQGVEGEAVVKLPRILDNAGDVVSSAFATLEFSGIVTP